MGIGVTATVLMATSTPAFAALDGGFGGAPASASGVSGAGETPVAGPGAAGLLWLVAGLLAVTVGLVLATRPRRGPARDPIPASPAPGNPKPRPDDGPSFRFTNSNSHDKPNGATK